MIERVFKVFEKDMNKKQLSFLIQTDLKFPGTFLAEWELYELILFHIVCNAVKFSNSGGSITVILSPREILIEGVASTTLKTTVRDRGVGISEEKIKKIKQVLIDQSNPKQMILTHAGDRSQTIGAEGGIVGFGLSTAGTLCNLLGGELSLSSFPWYKTEFEFTFLIKQSFARGEIDPIVVARNNQTIPAMSNRGGHQFKNKLVSSAALDVKIKKNAQNEVVSHSPLGMSL